MKGTLGMMRRRAATTSRVVGRILFAPRAISRGPEHLNGLMTPDKVQLMFKAIANTYDLQNRFLSAWLDTHWRNVFVRYLRLNPGERLGDIAVGTGEISIRASRRYPGIRITGVDFSPDMLRVARRKVREHGYEDRIDLMQGDMRKLPLDSNLFDVVTISFGIRNVVERDAALKECFRVLKPGGRLLIMEPGFLDVPLLGPAYRFYFDHVMPLFGNLLSGTDYAYTYLSETVYAFPPDEEFVRAFEEAGFVDANVVRVSYGIARIYRGRKPAAGGRARGGSSRGKSAR
ncbi:MAG TPA: ubiquinone/menaquinone biosynthesis methyltransferase [Spirochaetia bacterium]|nr:ubiquinone/menaquinone biosynthesis methyltransferase [Spirochaetia bacterium]